MLASSNLPPDYQPHASRFFSEVLLRVQQCPLNNVRIAALDLWLDLNDVSERDAQYVRAKRAQNDHLRPKRGLHGGQRVEEVCGLVACPLSPAHVLGAPN